jgi:hypothetical protein
LSSPTPEQQAAVDAVAKCGGNKNAAARLEETARLLREIPVSDRTANLIELQCMVVNCMVRAGPDDTADFAALVAKLMRQL